ncbi:NmrA family NAD(P)-binding protein [Reichenbachiella versicolor]|uniref:NmrA family NAD(P)-binding protein n=1 Tax=Reichenbachiella versicolor TaxID=1821036 RepID=UPI000D6E879F|nr:NmrA family NAD(P)-binding protein [Reichenbachiella versicolor]
MKTNILVIGGTGKTGRKVAQKLNALDYNVRIGSRSANIPFDWNKSETWAPALEGMEKVYITFQPDLAVPGAKEAILQLADLAIKSGIKKVVLLSGKGELEAEACEKIIMDSGIDYTIVRASWFSQNFSESFFIQPILEGHVALPKPEAQVPYVDTDDISDVVVAALTSDDHARQLYELTGPRTLTFEEVVDEISKATGRKIGFTPISLEEYISFLEGAGVPADHVWLINYLFGNVLDAPGNNRISNDIEKVLGRKAKDFSQYVTETAKTGVWNQTQEAAV